MVDGQGASQDSSKTSVTTQETSQQASKTYTEAEMNKIINDRLASAGREAKKLQELEAKLKADQDRLRQLEREREADEEAKLKDKPDEFSVYKTRKELKQREEALKEREAELLKQKEEADAILHTARENSRLSLIKTLAEKHGLDAKILDKPYLKSDEEIEDYAKTLSGVKPAQQGSYNFDSGIANAGGGAPTTEQLSNMTTEEYAKWRLKQLDPNRKK